VERPSIVADDPFGEYQGEAQYGVQPPPIALALGAAKPRAAITKAPNRIFDMASGPFFNGVTRHAGAGRGSERLNGASSAKTNVTIDTLRTSA
jgi:hypothetical protein